MLCPRCDGNLVERQINEVSPDTCDKCGGTWLDLGELEQIVKRRRQWLLQPVIRRRNEAEAH